MVPIPPPKESWAESQINELFSSLLGAKEEENKQKTDNVSIGNLKLF